MTAIQKQFWATTDRVSRLYSTLFMIPKNLLGGNGRPAAVQGVGGYVLCIFAKIFNFDQKVHICAYLHIFCTYFPVFVCIFSQFEHIFWLFCIFSTFCAYFLVFAHIFPFFAHTFCNCAYFSAKSQKRFLEVVAFYPYFAPHRNSVFTHIFWFLCFFCKGELFDAFVSLKKWSYYSCFLQIHTMSASSSNPRPNYYLHVNRNLVLPCDWGHVNSAIHITINKGLQFLLCHGGQRATPMYTANIVCLIHWW